MLEALRAEFKGRALDPDRLFLLNGRDAIAFIDRCVAGGLVLLGVEGFRVTDEGAFQPDQTQSNDIGEAPAAQDFVEATKTLIRGGMRLGYRYQVVVAERA